MSAKKEKRPSGEQAKRKSASKSPEPEAVIQVVEDTLGHEHRGVSVHHITTVFAAEVEAAGFNLLEFKNIYDVEPTIIRGKGADVTCPRDGKMGAAYVDAIHGEDNAGRAQFMLSYTWAYPIIVIVHALALYCSQHDLDPKRTYIWIDCFCVNQHRVQEAAKKGSVNFEILEKLFEDKVTEIGTVLALMFPWAQPTYLKRAWCVFEMYVGTCKVPSEKKRASTKQKKFLVETIMSPICEGQFADALEESETEFNKLWQLTQDVNAAEAEATVPQDLAMIKKKIEDGPTFPVLNSQVAQRLHDACVKTALANVDRLLRSVTAEDRVERWWLRLGHPDRGTFKAIAAAVPLGNESPLKPEEIDAFWDKLDAGGDEAVATMKNKLLHLESTKKCPRPKLLRATITTCDLMDRNGQADEAHAMAVRVIRAFKQRGGKKLLATPDGKELVKTEADLRAKANAGGKGGKTGSGCAIL